MLKVVIVLLLVAIIISLVTGAAFFFKDYGETKRTMYMLGIRISLAVLLMSCIAWGIYSGELSLSAPWHNR